MELLVTTHPGLEALALEELEELAASAGGILEGELRPQAHLGRVRLKGRGGDLEAVALRGRSIHHVLRRIDEFQATTLGAIVRAAARWDVPELDEGSWCVRCRRVGAHAFSSVDVEREVGAALFARCAGPVRLRGWDHCVRVELRGSHCAVGLQRTQAPLSHRFYPRPYQQRTALKANVAFAALRQLPSPPRTLLDPFAGSGTILLEAGAVLPRTRLFGSDRRSLAADGCRANLTAFGLAHRSEVRAGEVERLAEVWEDRRFDAIVTNPPYGVRMGAGLDFARFYARLLLSAGRVLAPGGSLVLLATHEDALRRAAAAQGWRVGAPLRVETRSVRPAIVRLWRPPG